MWFIFLYQILVYILWINLTLDLDGWFLYLFVILVNLYLWKKFNVEKLGEIKEGYIFLATIIFLVVWLFRTIDIVSSFF